ncbi:MAG TPA: hypothetical protein VGK54_05055, partial [Chloroflexota bacterium]
MRAAILPALSVLVLLLTGCSPSSLPVATNPDNTSSSPAFTGPKTMQAIMKVEPASLAAKPLTATGISIA